MVVVKPLKQIPPDDLKRLVQGYSSDSKYLVHYSSGEESISFKLALTRLEQTFRKRFTYLDEETIEYCAGVVTQGYSFGAFDQQELVGLLIAEPRWWNKDLWVWEFHIAAPYQRKGIGRRLMTNAVQKAEVANLRSITCETQNTNVNAIQVYRKLGFRVEGIDISYYSNEDYPDGEIAIFMRRRI
ncbi:MAG: GNAT family N-acetyltransferase [Anaerolineales bacterium]